MARATSIPIATGERLTTKYEFARVLETGAASILQLNLGRVGGLLEAKKIAALAEAHYAQIAPHLYCGPVVGAANIQLSTCSPNFLILEGILDWGGFHAEILKTPIRWEDGYVIPPTTPGLGVELDEEVAARHPYEGDELHLTPAVRALQRIFDGKPGARRSVPTASSSSFTTIGDQASPPYSSRARMNVCSTSVASSSGTPSSVAEVVREAEVLAGEVEREADVVAPVEDHLALGLVDEARAGARLDHLERLRQVEPAALCQHQRLAGGDEMDEREHVRDHLDHRGAAKRADVEDPAADRLEHRQVRSEDLGIAADDDGDLPGRRKVNAAGDRCLEARDPLRGGEGREPLELVAVVRARVDPRAACARGLRAARSHP